MHEVYVHGAIVDVSHNLLSGVNVRTFDDLDLLKYAADGDEDGQQLQESLALRINRFCATRN